MSITVSRYAYENGINSLRIDGVKSASIDERLNQDHTRCLDIGFYSTEDLQALQDGLNNIFPETSNLQASTRNQKKTAYILLAPDCSYIGIRKAIGVSEHTITGSHALTRRK